MPPKSSPSGSDGGEGFPSSRKSDTVTREEDAHAKQRVEGEGAATQPPRYSSLAFLKIRDKVKKAVGLPSYKVRTPRMAHIIPGSGLARDLSRNLAEKDKKRLQELGLNSDDLHNEIATLYAPMQKRNKSSYVHDWLNAASMLRKSAFKDKIGGKLTMTGWKDTRKTCCFRFFWLAMAGLASAIFADHEVHKHSGYTIRSLSLQFITAVSSACAIHQLVWFYHCEMCIMRLKGWKLPATFSPTSLASANLLQQFLRDLIFLIPQPIPFVTTHFNFAVYDSGLDRTSVYPIDVLLLTFMFIRVLFIPRFFSHCIQDLHTDDAEIYFSLSKTVLDDSFLLRFTMSTSLTAVGGIFILQIVLYAYTLLMFERSTEEGPLKNWASTIWLIVTTMTTVGYGDVYPTTRLGRIIAVTASFSAMAMMAITISLVQSSLELSRTEQKVMWLNNARDLVRVKRIAAGKLIMATLRVNNERNRCSREMLAVAEEEKRNGKDPNKRMWTYRPPDQRLASKLDPDGRPGMRASMVEGGGRGCARVAEVYGKLLPDNVVTAESKWHVALREFRAASRDLLHDHNEVLTDVPAMISDVMCRTVECDNALEDIDHVLCKAEDAVLGLIAKKEGLTVQSVLKAYPKQKSSFKTLGSVYQKSKEAVSKSALAPAISKKAT